MSDWSLLPEELLHLISKNLEENNCFDVVHARSVCSSWRSAFPFPSSLPSYSLPSFMSESQDLCTLQKVPLFLFSYRAPHANVAEYFMRAIGRDESKYNMELTSPPHQCSVKVKITGSDQTLSNCQILSLGHQYRMIGWMFNDHAFLRLDKEEGKRGEFVVLLAYSRALMVLTSAEMRWKRLENVPDTSCLGIVTYRGKFYATFLSREIFVIDPYSLEVTLLLPSPQERTHFLVPSGNDELFLVKGIVWKFNRFACRVSKLDEEAGKWVEVSDLGDRVLLIGDLGTVSCSAKELPHGCGLNGNTILFVNETGYVFSSYKYGVHT